MVVRLVRVHGIGVRTTEESIHLIETAATVELMAFSRDGDPLAMVPIAKSEALELVALPVTMGHVFRTTLVEGGRVFDEPVEWEG